MTGLCFQATTNKSIIPRQHFQQFNLENQVRIRRDLAHGSLAIGKVRWHPQLALAADLHAHDALVASISYVGFSGRPVEIAEASRNLGGERKHDHQQST